MKFKMKFLSFLSSTALLCLLAGCAPGEDFSPGEYATTHEGQSWVLDFKPDGSWTGTFSGEIISSGTYTIDGDQLTWLTDSHCQETGYPGAAVYRLSIREDSLRFSRIGKDPCLSRQVILEDEVYHPAP